MSCACPHMQCQARCGEAVERAKDSRYFLCHCPRPLDFAVQNGKGPVSSNLCARCGLWLSQSRRYHPDTAPDREVMAVWLEQQRAQAWLPSSRHGARRWKVKRDDLPRDDPHVYFEKTTASYMTATHVNATRFVGWLDRHKLVLQQRDQKHAAEWRRGSRARVTIEIVDRILVGFGRHLSELPDEVFER